MLPQEIIRRKRDGRRLDREEIDTFIAGVTSGRIGEGQIAAFCMAVLWRGMDHDERVALTLAMARSGQTVDWSPAGLDGPVLDKHSTGGIGDKVSLILAPVIAACGGYVPMISGRGLGHTGGTLDKLESIPGYGTRPEVDTVMRAVRDAGCAIIGATDALAPADGRIYAVRDVTATVESIDLITASILSKKLAAGLDGLAMDVKVGNGAFCGTMEEAETLAGSLVDVALSAGLPTVALVTDMNQVLGHSAGNAVEVAEAVDLLTGGHRDPRLYEVTATLAAELLVLGRLFADSAAARAAVDAAIDSGAAAERFARMVAALGGPADLVDDPWRRIAKAPVQIPVEAPQSGIIRGTDTRALGLAVVALGGGRTDPRHPIDHAVGLTEVAAPGQSVGPSARPLALVHARRLSDAEAAARRVAAAFRVDSAGPAESTPAVHRHLG